jgi:hypothetical protein
VQNSVEVDGDRVALPEEYDSLSFDERQAILRELKDMQTDLKNGLDSLAGIDPSKLVHLG